MGKSFFTGSYTQLFAGSLTFSRAITATPEAFGLSALAASSYAALHEVYAAAYMAASMPKNRTPAKTTARNDAAIPLRVMAKQLADIINGTPSVTDDQKLSLCLSVRAKRTPVTTLGTANKFKAELLGNGALQLKWQCASPRAIGVMYQVWRSLDGGTNYAHLGTVGEKKWTDETIPSGTPQAMYKIQAVRSKVKGDSAVFIVCFGTSSRSAVATSLKIAA